MFLSAADNVNECVVFSIFRIVIVCVCVCVFWGEAGKKERDADSRLIVLPLEDILYLP